jgi:lysophospholipase L1-like esterase
MIRFVRRAVAASAVLGVLVLGGPTAAQAEEQPIRIMPLGDSITWGVGTPGHDSYRTELGDRLTRAGLDVDFVGSQQSGTGADPDNEGHPGWTIDQIAEHVDEWLATYEPDVILLHIGTNDLHVGAPSPATRLEQLLEQIHAARPQAQVVVAQLIGLGLTGYTGGQAARTADYNRALTDIVADLGEPFHLADLSYVHGVDLHDRLHPNAFGYRRMAWGWYHALEPLLNTTGTPWPAFDNPEGGATAVRCLGRTVRLPDAARGCRTWLHRRPAGPIGARVWQLPVRRTVVYRVGSQLKLRTVVRWVTAP